MRNCFTICTLRVVVVVVVIIIYLVTGLFFLVILLNQQWSPPLRLQASHSSTFRIMCDVPSIAVFCSESIECFPGTASRFFLKLVVTIPEAPIITGIIVHYYYYCSSSAVASLITDADSVLSKAPVLHLFTPIFFKVNSTPSVHLYPNPSMYKHSRTYLCALTFWHRSFTFKF